MKATNYTAAKNILKSIIILTGIFLLQINTLLAGNEKSIPSEEFSFNSLILILSPSTPKEADFNDAAMTVSDLTILVPSVPAEADFSDSDPATISITALAPATPTEADFTD